jgi:hypothetical protein
MDAAIARHDHASDQRRPSITWRKLSCGGIGSSAIGAAAARIASHWRLKAAIRAAISGQPRHHGANRNVKNADCFGITHVFDRNKK